MAASPTSPVLSDAGGATGGFDTAKAGLMVTDAQGYSVYDHIYGLVTRVLEENPGNVVKNVDRLPHLSCHVKGHRFEAKRAEVGHKIVLPGARDIEQARVSKRLFHRPPPEVKTEILQPTPYTTVTTTTVIPVQAPPCRPLSMDSRYHRMCGVGMHSREYFLLEQAITQLTLERKLQDVRFFGKIFGTQKNYYVVVSRRWFEDPGHKLFAEKYAMPKQPRKHTEVPMQKEPPGIGANRVTFWVCTQIGGEWQPLPDVTPQLITASRKIKKYFTGDLDAELTCYPIFPGSEREYLRAQLARLYAATQIAPEGEVEVFEGEDEEEEEGEEEGGAQPKELKWRPLVTDAKPVPLEEGIESLASREKWVHTQLHIYKTGRATMLPEKPEVEGEEPPPEEEEEEGEPEKEEEKKDLLQPLASDGKFAVIRIPQEPKDEEGEGEGEGEEEGEGKEEEDEDEEKEEPAEEEGEGDEEDPTKLVIHPWITSVTNNFFKKHGVVVVKSIRWPGAVAWAASNQVSGCVYFGNGLKSTDSAFAPAPAPPVQTEPQDFKEMDDPSSMTEKLVLRGEEPKEADSEDEKEEEEEEAAE
eukprot:Sspe_Gene.1402::Locus_467_Transcript_1_1_Confidence_1.000_Length_1842::g.1402::m.1402/K19756/RSPH4A; radial spoke head protein 4A